MNFGAISLSRTLLKELTSDEKVSSFVDVLYGSLIKSIKKQKSNFNPSLVQIIVSQTYSNKLLKEEFRIFFDKEIKNNYFDVIHLADNKYQDFLLSLFENRFDFKYIQIDAKDEILTIIENAIKATPDSVIDNTSEKQWLFQISRSNWKILDGLERNEDKIEILTNIIDQYIQKLDKQLIYEEKKKNDNSLSETWNKYAEFEENFLDKSVFGFPLKSIFVEPYLSGYPIVDNSDKYSYGHQTIGADEFYNNNLLNKAGSNIHYVSGDPGVGKSSLVYYWCKKLSLAAHKFCILKLNRSKELILNSTDILNEIRNCIQPFTNKDLDKTSFSSLINNAPVFYLFFDGLDEFNPRKNIILEKLKVLKAAVEEFIDMNSSNVDLKIVILGRPLAIASLKPEGKVGIYKLLTLKEKLDESYDKRIDLVKKFKIFEDREVRQFCLCHESEYQFEITRYPLLLSRLLHEIISGNRNVLKSINKYDFYNRMFAFHFNRDKEKHHDLAEFDYFKFFSKVGHISWEMGNVRQIDINSLECDPSISRQIKNVTSAENRKVFSSYFVRSYFVESIKSSEFFEYHHKSFGEFFAAKHFISAIRNMFAVDKTFQEYLRQSFVLFHRNDISIYQYQWVFDGLLLPGFSKGVKHRFFSFLFELLENIFGSRKERIVSYLMDDQAVLRRINKLDVELNNFIKGLFVFNSLIDKNEWYQKINCSTVLDDMYIQMVATDNKNLSSYKDILKKLNLQEANFEGANLGDIDLSEANLKNANFKRANLKRANLQSADLEGGDLRASNLEFTNFKSSNLKNAKLSKSSLSNSKMFNANLENADMEHCVMIATKLNSANLQHANLRRANIRYSSFEAAKLQNSSFNESTISESDLRFTKLSNADFSKVVASKSDFRGADFDGTNLNKAVFDESKFKNIKNFTKDQLSIISIKDGNEF